MQTIYHPIDDAELMILIAALKAADIPFFVIGQNFGSLFPGAPITGANDRAIQVPEEHVETAMCLINDITGEGDEDLD